MFRRLNCALWRCDLSRAAVDHALRRPLGLVALFACGPATPEPAAQANAAPVVMDFGRTRVLAQIGAARAERGLPPVNVVDDSGPLSAAEREILRGASPDQAIRTGAPARGRERNE
jgi:hypothetical protein